MASLVQGLKLKRLKRGEWEADFQETLVEVRHEVAALGPISRAQSISTLSLLDESGATDAATIVAVIQAWNEVEGVIDVAARDAGLQASTLPEKVRSLADKGLLAPSTVDAVSGLRVLRNLAVHAPQRLPPAKAREFVEMARAVTYAMTMNLKQHAKSAQEQ